MSRTNVILAPVADNRVTADGALVGNTFPQNRIEFAVDGSSVTWLLSVRGVVGAPTSWTLEARFVNVLEHSSGPQFSIPELVPFSRAETENFVHGGVGWGKPNQAAQIANPAYNPQPFTSSGGILATNPAFDPREKIDNPAVPRSAGDWGLIADSTDGLGGSTVAYMSRTVDCFNLRHKLQLRPVFTGGTNPGLVMTMTAQVND